MTKIHTKILGKQDYSLILPAHFLSKSLDLFLTSSDVHKLIESIVFLSIGIETFIKTSLEKKQPLLIKRIDWNRWNNIKS